MRKLNTFCPPLHAVKLPVMSHVRVAIEFWSLDMEESKCASGKKKYLGKYHVWLVGQTTRVIRIFGDSFT